MASYVAREPLKNNKLLEISKKKTKNLQQFLDTAKLSLVLVSRKWFFQCMNSSCKTQFEIGHLKARLNQNC